MLLCLDPTSATLELTAGRLECPHTNCYGQLRPWGHARLRRVRHDPTSGYRPRRARCAFCRRTQVLLSVATYPRRPDTVETVAEVLLGAVRGLSYRQLAKHINIPATTMRGWIRRAQANSEHVRVRATQLAHAFDPLAHPIEPTGSPLGDMIEAVGRAVVAAACRLGPSSRPWASATLMTRGAILAPPRPAR